MATPIDEYIQELGALGKRLEELVDKKFTMQQGEFNKWVEQIKALQLVAEDYRRSKVANMDDRGRIIVREGRFAGLSPLDLAIVKSVFRGRHIAAKLRPEIWEDLEKAQKALRTGITRDMLFDWQERLMRQRGIMSGQSMEAPGSLLFRHDLDNWRHDIFRQLNKAMDSTVAGAGDELVPTFEAAEVWMDVNLETKVLPLFRQSPMPTNPYDIPRQFGDNNWYPATQNVQVTTTDPTTAKSTLTAYGLKTGTPFSDELEEDSIVAFVPELRSNLARQAAEIIDDILINADATTGTGNINRDGATLDATVAGKAHYVLGFDGLYHLPFVDNTAQRSRAAAVLANTSYNNVLLLLGKYAAPNRRGDVVFIAPINVVLKTLTLAQVETIEKYGPRATISSGEITSIYGTPLIMSEQFLLADTTGEVRSASSNNTTGRIIGVNTTQWRVGFRRQIEFEPSREAGKSQTTLYVSFRIAFTESTGTRSSATHTAAVYDISSVT